MRICLILNPHSGHLRRHPRLRDFLQEHAAVAGIEVCIEATQGPGHAVVLAREAASRPFHAVVAVGGDGTVNEVACGLMGTEMPLGIVPMGSGNGLARSLHIPLRPEKALLGLAHFSPRLIDTGLADGKRFLCTTGLGFDAAVIHRFNQGRRRGFLGYLLAALREWSRYSSAHYTISVDGRELSDDRRFIVAVANASEYGNGARIAPSASLSDGLLNLVAVPQAGFLNGPWLLRRLFNGTLDQGAGIRTVTGREFVIQHSGPPRHHVDGELRSCTKELRVAVEPGSLRVLQPTPCD